MPFVYEYPRPSVSADAVVFDAETNSVLLIRRLKPPFADAWALPGGFMEMDEDAGSAALRELHEETGLSAREATQIGAYSDVDRDPRGRVVTIAFFVRSNSRQSVAAADDAKDVRWFPVGDLPRLAFDHAQIIQDGLSKFVVDRNARE